MRVVAALSGGVDSAVAAARAVDAGHDVVGVHLALAKVSGTAGSRGCCTPEDARDARRVADILGIPFYVWDLAEEFHADVVEDFVAEYAAGRTPHPCLRCNERIKFAAVLDRARGLGFDAVCTGHYARLVDAAGGRELHRAVDRVKDQSYVLAVLDADQLAGAMFPLGDDTKDVVRAQARNRGLLVADKPDSHDLCFVPTGDTAGYLAERLGDTRGELVDALTGAVIGEHAGTYGFTIGQRRGLDLREPAPSGERRYVVGIDAARQQVLVGTAELLSVGRIIGSQPRWCGPEPTADLEVSVQVRSHGDPVPGVLRIVPDGVVVELETPLRGVAPGQAAVFYDGTRVVGSATIDTTERSSGSSQSRV